MKRTKIFTALALALLGLAGLAAAQRAKMIQIKGSDTMVNLVQILAEEYMGKTPGSAIAVLGGGSGTGITGLINQTCDIANSSREWKPKEIDLAWEKGVKPRFFVVAVDGLSVIVNEKNPLTRLTMAQVGAIYRGEIKNWKAVGEFAKPVSLYGRQSNSGTYVFMQEFVLGNKNYSADMKEMNGNAQIIEGVLQDEGGRRLRRRRLPLRREGPGPQGPQGPRDLQGARRAGLPAHRQGGRRLRPIPDRPAPLHGHQRQAQGRRGQAPGLDHRPRGPGDRRARRLLHDRRRQV